VSESVVADLNESTFDSICDPNVMARKYLKLLSNLGNAIEAACGIRSEDPAVSELWNLAQDEGSRCFEAAGIEAADEALDASAVRLSALCDGSTIANLPAAPRGRALSAGPAISRPTG